MKKKTISLTEEQVVEILVAIRSEQYLQKQFLQLAQEEGSAEEAAKWEARISLLEQVEEKIRRAKWRG